MKHTPEFVAAFGRRAKGTMFPAIGLSRRQFLKTIVAALALAVAGLGPAALADGRHGDDHGGRDRDKRWVGTWTASPRIPAPTGAAAAIAFNNQTLRQIVYTSIGGDRVRVRLTNSLGTVPLVIGAARIALRDVGEAIVPGSDRVLTFGGAPSVTIEAGAHVLSDPVHLDVPELGEVAVSIYLPGSVGPSTTTPVTYHATARQTNYFSPQDGDHTGDVVMPVLETSVSWWFLMGVDVKASKETGAIVTLGDSITDGTASTLDANNRYPNYLARRLLAKHGHHHKRMAVLNAGIAGNRVLTGGTSGPNVQARFDRDVLVQPGVTHVIVLEGINDIGNASTSPTPSAADIIAGHKQLIERAHELGLRIFGATLTPFTGVNPPYYSPEGEAKRQAVNEWIRTSGEYDGVIDFDEATRDPANPTQFLPAYDSGDHLHPSDAGYEAMADAINLRLFKQDDDD
jgi:lysophospholipase L1-like esterase